MRLATQPLDPGAVKAANAAVASETCGRALTTAPQDDALRGKWLDAYAAAGGKTTNTSSKSRKREKARQAAAGGKSVGSPVQPCPLKNKPPPVTTAPPKDKKIKCAIPYVMRDKESRKANDAFVLEVVPGSPLGSDTVTVKGFGGGCSCSGAKVGLGDTNTLVNSLTKVSGWGLGGSKFQLIQLLGEASPRVLPVALTCGLDQSLLRSGEIHVYPSDKVEITAELKGITQQCPRVDDALKQMAGVLSRMTGKEIDPYNGCEFEAGLGNVTINPPTLSLSFEAQWKEYKVGSDEEWQAYFGWKASVGVGVSIEFKLDLVKVGAAATGVGTAVIALYDRLTSYLGQEEPIFFVSFEAKVQGSGSVGYEEEPTGSIGIEGTGTIAIGGNITTDVVEASVEASTAISSLIEGEPEKTGLKLAYELLKWNGVEGKASVKLNAGRFFSIGFERSAELIGEMGPLIEGTIL